MQAAGYQLLACTIRSGDQHACIGRGNLCNHIPDLLERRRGTNHLLSVHFFLEHLVVLHEYGAFGCVLDSNKNAVKIERFGDVVKRPPLDAVYGGIKIAVAGYHHYRRVNSLALHVVQHLISILHRHLDVAEHNIVVFFAYHLDTGGAVFGQVDLISFVTKNLLQRIPDGTLIIYHKYFHSPSFFCFASIPAYSR